MHLGSKHQAQRGVVTRRVELTKADRRCLLPSTGRSSLQGVTGGGALGEAEHPRGLPSPTHLDDISVKPTQPGKKKKKKGT